MTMNKIRDLNDKFRFTLTGGRVIATAHVAAFDRDKQIRLFEAVRNFDKFTKGNDPYGEHDFAFLDFEGDRFFWKIDYYDARLEYGSEDPADPKKTTRVLTVGHASDY